MILAHCLRNTTYDPQSEGNKTKYLFEIIQLTQEQGFYRNAILAAMQALPASPEDDFDDLDWVASQLFEFGVLFAQHGDEAFRQATYDLFVKRATSHCEFGADNLIELDGLAGFLFVAKHLYSLPEPSTPTLNAWYIDIVEERFGAEAVRKYIEREVDDPGLKSYIVYPREHQAARSKRHNVSTTHYDEVKQWITQWQAEPIHKVGDVDQRLPRFVRWGRDASEEALVEVAQDLLVAEEALLLPYLTIFRSRCFPLNHERLLALAASANSDIALAAIAALAHIEHPNVHLLALSLLQFSTKNYPALDLLIKNYQEGDHVLIESVLAQQSDKDHLHRAGISTLEIFEVHSTVACAGSLLYIYEYGPCTYCRQRTIQLLLTQHILPDWIAREARYDSNFAIRELILKY